MQPDRYRRTSVEDRYIEFGEYLREVLRQRGWVEPALLDVAPARTVVEKFRFCSCGTQCYSEAEERQAIMEFDAPSATLAALEVATRSHGDTH